MESSERAVASLVRNWSGADDELRERVRAFLWCGDDDLPDVLREDPHTLGWLQQYLGEAQRRREFAAHTSTEAKHSSATSTTQLYTPRWVADWLVMRTFSTLSEPATVVFDPACGGGQMLLAAADHLVGTGTRPIDAAGMLHGVDLDPNAVWACRESIKLWLGRQGVEDGIPDLDAQIVVGNGLEAGPERADVVLTNPPYMGTRSMPPHLKQELRGRAPFHHDLYLAFIDRCTEVGRSVGILAQQTVWYLRRFEDARLALLERGQLAHFAHLGHGVFDGLSGEKANVVAFTWVAGEAGPTEFWDCRGEHKMETLAGEPQTADVTEFSAIPSSPIAFWLAPKLRASFARERRLGDIADIPGSQNKTGNNGRYVMPIDEAPDDWVPYSKGGKFAPWWGNWDWAVDWSDEARAFYASNRTSNLLREEYWFREGLCYSDFGGRTFNARWMPPGCVFDMAGPAVFVSGDDPDVLAAILVIVNSTAARAILNALNPTLHYQVRDVRNLPLPGWSDALVARLAPLGHQLVKRTRSAVESGAPNESILELELEADRRVAEAFGTPELVATERRVHHRLE